MNTASNSSDDPLAPAEEPVDRDALLLRIEPRRYVVVRREGRRRVEPIEGGWDALCRVQPGDRVIYEGTPTVVKAVEVY